MKRFVMVMGAVSAMYLAVTSSALGGDSGDARSLPAAATQIIDRVRQAAEQRDLAGLRKLMVREFKWSFGGDSDADQDPRFLREMARIPWQGCHIIDTPDGWRIEYFVEGD